MERKYAVIEFTTEKSVELVPKSWLCENNSKCLWPYNLRGSNLTNAIKKTISPGKDWILFPARLLRLLDDYDHGKKLAEKAEFTSDLESTDEECGSTRRATRSTQKPNFVYEKDFMNNIQMRVEEIPVSSLSEFRFIEPELPITFVSPTRCGNDQLESTLGQENILRVSTAEGFESGNNIADFTCSTQVENALLDISNTTQHSLAAPMSPNLLTIRAEIEGLKSSVAEKLITIKEGLDLRFGKFQPTGTTVVKVTGGILKKLFSRGFAIHVNYSGLNRQESIKDSKLHHCIIESVRRHFPGQSVEEKVINKAIQTWFRGAKDRHGGRKRPNKISGVEQNQAPQNQS
ncbi:unnamed protein product [Allacma fusca]|uniref:DUF4806 domain-containing protein n=1 Tax=Allacma fusca TaxID=39272 RepID=A0A8J2NQN8_9HEXA|nr:unnamed protein product [Allacma fusca]